MGWSGVGGLTTLVCGGVHDVRGGGVGGLTTLICGGVHAWGWGGVGWVG